MVKLMRFSAAGALALLWLTGAQASDPVPVPATGKIAKKVVKPAPAETCGEHGTSLQFEASPTDAAKRALKEEKLVMVLHISGYFEDPDFT